GAKQRLGRPEAGADLQDMLRRDVVVHGILAHSPRQRLTPRPHRHNRLNVPRPLPARGPRRSLNRDKCPMCDEGWEWPRGDFTTRRPAGGEELLAGKATRL